jgi:RHS repeat-associated protein
LACYDANGNIIAWTETTGRVLQRQDYDPFGNRVIRERLAITTEQSERLEYGFSTKPLDAETGLIYYIHRYYGPRHGQWLSQDPIQEAGGLNLYGFVGNAPIARYDIIGLDDNGYNPYIPGSFITSRSDFNPPPRRDLEIDRRNRDGGRAAGASAGDAEGKYLLDHYLTGGGRPLTITSWKAYMTADNAHTANPKYRQKLEKLLRDAASKRAGWTVGQSGPLNWAGHAEMANGEGMIGYEYLHGTNSFTIDGTITKKQDSSGKVIWEFDAHYNWKDDINKNNGYVTDIFKNMVAETITFGGAMPYTVESKFDSKSTMDACDPPASAKGQEWPFKSTP